MSTCVPRAGRKRVPLTTKRQLSPSVKEERAKIVKSKKIRLLESAATPTCATSKPKAAAKNSATNGAQQLVLIPVPAATPVVSQNSAKGKTGARKRNAKQSTEVLAPPRTRARAILPKPDPTKISAWAIKVEPVTLNAVPMVISPVPEVADAREPVLNCKECHVATSSKSGLQRHYQSAHPTTLMAEAADDEPYVCYHCGYTCKRKFDLQRHIVSVHLPRLDSDVEPLTCGVCWRNYTSKSALRRHVVSKHFADGDRTEEEEEETRMLKRPKKSKWDRGYCCDICGRGYEMQRQMLAHRDVYHPTSLPMRWSAFQASKGKLKKCARCSNFYRAGRFSEEHECATKDKKPDLEKQMMELLCASPCFRCDVCAVSFMWKLVFRQHREVTHPNVDPLNWDEVNPIEISYYCPSCYLAFDQKSDMAEHKCVDVDLEPKPKSHVCDICGGSYQRKSDYRRHRRFKHSIMSEEGADDGSVLECERKKPIINCPYCEMTTLTRNQILVHIKDVHNIDTDSPFVCVPCNKVFKRKATLDTHNQVYHPKGENALENERILRENEILLNGEPAFHCNMCNRNMFNAIRFLAHHRLHFVERKFTCDLCGKQTRTQHQLNTHIKIIHLNIRNYACDICRKSFHSKQSCEEHRRIHTGERPFSCEICGKTFVAMNALFTHKKFHDDFYPHACSMCPKKFKVRRSLTNHIRTHTGERPFKCDLCAKTFNNSSRFSYHKKVTHSDNRPHRCTLCGSRFKANKFLMRHMKLHKIRTHIQFRRRNNPDYFAANNSIGVGGSGENRSGDCVTGAKKANSTRSSSSRVGVTAALKKESKTASMSQATPQPRIQYKIEEGAALISCPAAAVVYGSAAPTPTDHDDQKSFDIVDVSLRFGQHEPELQSMSDGYEDGAVGAVPQRPCYPPSSADQ